MRKVVKKATFSSKIATEFSCCGQTATGCSACGLPAFKRNDGLEFPFRHSGRRAPPAVAGPAFSEPNVAPELADRPAIRDAALGKQAADTDIGLATGPAVQTALMHAKSEFKRKVARGGGKGARERCSSSSSRGSGALSVRPDIG